MADSKGHRSAFSKQHNKPLTIKQFSDLPVAWGPPMGAAQSPTDHPVHNLASRDSVPLGTSGAPAAGMFDSEHKDGGSTDTGTGKSNY